MSKIIMVTGGARSGKSSFAEKIAKESQQRVAYIATAIAFDEGMQDRIFKHQKSRPQEWQTIEKYKEFNALEGSEVFNEADMLLLDCVTILITNLMMDSGLDFDNCDMYAIEALERVIKEEIHSLIQLVRVQKKNIILVTNEVGMGLVPAYKMGNYFRDIAGRMNQFIANEADEVYFAVSGIPMRIK